MNRLFLLQQTEASNGAAHRRQGKRDKVKKGRAPSSLNLSIRRADVRASVQDCLSTAKVCSKEGAAEVAALSSVSRSFLEAPSLILVYCLTFDSVPILFRIPHYSFVLLGVGVCVWQISGEQVKYKSQARLAFRILWFPFALAITHCGTLLLPFFSLHSLPIQHMPTRICSVLCVESQNRYRKTLTNTYIKTAD